MDHQTRWTVPRIARYLETITPLVYRQRQPLPHFRLKVLDGPEATPPITPEIDDSDWPAVEPESYWVDWFTDFTLRTWFTIPATWDKTKPLALYLPLGIAGDFSHPEALAYIDGKPYAGCDRHHQEILLPPACYDGQAHLLALHGWTGRGGWQDQARGTRPLTGRSQLVQIDQPTRDFIAQARVALGVAQTTAEDDPAHGRLLNALTLACNQLNLHEPFGAPFYQSVTAAQELLAGGIAAAGLPLDVDLVAAGHAHIDVAWLWTLAQTRRKASRTFYTVLRLMEQFPTYHFTQSQPQLYDYVRQDDPELFAAIKEQVANGLWEAIGGMWVEADCNLSGAESLARQFLLGRSFFRDHFGPTAESSVLWLPDVFGYAWALPQLIKQAGLDYFFTIKIGWSQYNRLPYDSFWWQGIDGTRVLTHFSTTPDRSGSYTSTYNAPATPESVTGTWRNFQQKAHQHTLLMAYGYGDGGGGPTREMLENLREMAAFPATPRVKTGKVIDFFRAMEAEAGGSLPTWNGELYLELHRGTYTSQSRNKRANRKSEFLLHDAEFLATYAAALGEQGLVSDSQPAGYSYPYSELNQVWQLVCLNQFHDIIPGSSIAAVYRDSLAQYEQVRETATTIKNEALAAIGQRLGGDLLLVNPTSFPQEAPVFWPEKLPAGRALQCAGTAVPLQPAGEGTWIAAEPLSPYSITPLTITMGSPPAVGNDLQVSPTHLENRYLRVTFNEAGDITGIYDKANRREVLPPGSIANQFQAFEDRPLDWDAWDIDIYYEDKMTLAEPAGAITVLERGPLRAALRIERRILGSTINQVIALVHNQPQLDFETRIDWQERHVLLKVAFPVDILATTATHEIQWGQVERPTQRNTSWDWARFETCAHKWVDLSEGDYGVSLLNDCKYGHDVHDNVLRLSLLRGSTFPDPGADLGLHHFTYSLRPHAGQVAGETIAAAYALNDPPFLHASATAEAPPGNDLPGASFISASRQNVIIETIKRAEDGRGMIIRLYESQRQRGPVTVTAAFPFVEAWRANLLEDDLDPLTPVGQAIDLHLQPFEIVTLRLV